MYHVLSEGSKWSGLGRPCGLLPCAPRYYYSTPRCLIVSNLSLGAPVCPCSLPVPCAWCVRGYVWCCVAAPLSCPACGVALSSTLPATHCPCNFAPYTPCIYVGVYAALMYWLSYCGLFFRLAISMLRSVHIAKAGPWNPNMDFKSRLEFSKLCFYYWNFLGKISDSIS